LNKVPSFNTKSAEKAFEILKNMLDSTQKDDKFKSYLNLGIIRLENLTKDKYLPYLDRHLNN